MNHAEIAARALRFRFRTIHAVDPDDAGYQADEAAGRAVACGDPQIDGAIRRLASALIAAGVRPARLLEPWERPDIAAVFIERPELFDLVDAIADRTSLEPAG